LNVTETLSIEKVPDFQAMIRVPSPQSCAGTFQKNTN